MVTILSTIFLSLLLSRMVLSKRYSVDWTAASVSEYNEEYPLVVHTGDMLDFTCPSPVASNIYVTDSRLSYLTCNCSITSRNCYNAVPLCRDGIVANSIMIWVDTNPTRSIYKYHPGKTYYFTDFPFGKMEGGKCLSNRTSRGLKLVIHVEKEKSGSASGRQYMAQIFISEPQIKEEFFTITVPEDSFEVIIAKFGLANFLAIMIIGMITAVSILGFVGFGIVLIRWNRKRKRRRHQLL